MLSYALRSALSGLLLGLLVAVGPLTESLARAQNAPGPRGAVSSLAVDAKDGSLVKAEGGLFRSADQGQTWMPVSLPDDLHPDKLRVVATHPKAPSSLYAAGPGAGIVRSDDGGQTWRTVSDGLPSQEVEAFAVHSDLPDTFYAWIKGRGVFRTENNGGKWELMDEGPPGDGPPISVLALAHSTLEGSMNTGWLYAATPDGPYLSMDCF